MPPNDAAQQTVAHYLSGTHWDREWYRPFQDYRVVLVELIDALLDLMENNPDFRYFHLDGQTCMLRDYLEVRPENQSRLRELIRSSRLLIGPWFTMPDLFCVGGEALVRNLLMGRRVCSEWGVEPMDVGFVCDMFGHPSQMPQLFAGFGYDRCVLGRGTNEHNTPMYFRWESPDGSDVFVFKLQDAWGYGAFNRPRTALETRVDQMDKMTSDLGQMQQELSEAGDDADDASAIREKYFRALLKEYIDHEMSRANGAAIALMDWMDHAMPATDVQRYLRLVNETRPDLQVEHSTLPAFMDQAESTAHDVPTIRGELRQPSRNRVPHLYLIPNCVSARVRMKQHNDACQTLLEKWVEPLAAIADPGGNAIPPRLLRIAWEHLLLNHAHDSICGCSVDQVHRDMSYRFDQTRVLGEQLRARAIGLLTAGCRELGRTRDEFTLTLVNPLPEARREVVVFDVDLPPDYPASFHEGFNTQEVKAFHLEDESGRRVPYQRLGLTVRANERSRYALPCFSSAGPFDRYTVAAEVAWEGMGFTSLRVVPSDKPVRTVGSLRTGPAAAENEHLVIEIAPSGTLTLTDKATGQTYNRLLQVDSRSEIGDGWFHGHGINDEQHLAVPAAEGVSVVHDGPELVTLRTTLVLRVPKRYDYGHERPSEERTDVRVSHSVTLRRGAQAVEVETMIDNTAEDHRLQLLMPTDVEADTYLAHHPFDFVERPITVDPQTADWQEMEQVEKPFLGMQSVGAGDRGLCFVSGGGLHQGGVRDDARRTMQVTLLRSFRRTVGTGGEPDGLEQGEVRLRYALMPYGGRLPRVAALRAWDRLRCGTFTRQSGQRASGFPPLDGDAPVARHFLRVESGDAIVTTAKPAESGGSMVVRVWNPTDAPTDAVLWCGGKVEWADRLDLAEQIDTTAPTPTWENYCVTVRVAPSRIATVAIKLQGDGGQDNRH